MRRFWKYDPGLTKEKFEVVSNVVWRRSHELVLELYRVTKAFPDVVE